MNQIKTQAVLSREEHLAVPMGMVVDSAIHAADEELRAGLVFGKKANGKFRAYAEGTVDAATPFSNASVNFKLTPTGELVKYFKVGDTIESTGGTALGVIATFDPTTGVGTLTGNAANNLAAGNTVRVVAAELSIAKGDIRILGEYRTMPAQDYPVAGYNEGFFTKSATTLTAAAITSASAKEPSSDEVRL